MAIYKPAVKNIALQIQNNDDFMFVLQSLRRSAYFLLSRWHYKQFNPLMFCMKRVKLKILLY